MKITFCLPHMSKYPVGGFKIVFEYANRLTEKGHQVNIVFFTNNSFQKITNHLFIKDTLGKILNYRIPTWFELDKRISKIATAYLDGRDIPTSDVIIATSVETALPVSQLDQKCGKKFYFIQGFENWNRSDEEVFSTYQLGMTNITISKWLQNIILPFDRNVELVSNAIDTEQFNVVVPVEKRNRFSLAMLHHENEHKGVKIAIEAIKLVKRKFPEITLQLFGTFKLPSYFDPDWMTYTKSASSEQLKEIYNSSSIFVCAATYEGFGLTGAEAMASGCVLASTSYDAVFEYAEDRVNSLLSPVGDSVALAENIIELIEDSNLRVNLAKRGSEKMQQFSWHKKVAEFEALLNKSR